MGANLSTDKFSWVNSSEDNHRNQDNLPSKSQSILIYKLSTATSTNQDLNALVEKFSQQEHVKMELGTIDPVCLKKEQDDDADELVIKTSFKVVE